MKNFVIVAALIGTSPAFAECPAEKAPKLGMTLEQVLASCWDAPMKMERRTTASHVEVRLTYEDGPSSSDVMIVDGKVTEIRERRSLTPDPNNTILKRLKKN